MYATALILLGLLIGVTSGALIVQRRVNAQRIHIELSIQKVGQLDVDLCLARECIEAVEQERDSALRETAVLKERVTVREVQLRDREQLVKEIDQSVSNTFRIVGAVSLAQTPSGTVAAFRPSWFKSYCKTLYMTFSHEPIFHDRSVLQRVGETPKNFCRFARSTGAIGDDG